MAIIRNTNESKKEESKINSRKINNKLDLLDQKLDSLYKDIYITRPDNKNNLDDILDKLDGAIDRIQDNEISVSGMSELLRRLDKSETTNSDKLINTVGELFNDQNLLSTVFANSDINKYISAQNYQYDMICKYLPKLMDALEIKRDNVLCSDNFSKNYINPKSNRSNKLENEKFATNCKKLEKEYEISEFIEKTYMNTSKYGEDFIYIVPYSTAFKRLLKRTNIRKNNARMGQVTFYENVKTGKSEVITCLSEGYAETSEYKAYKENVMDSFGNIEESKFKGYDVNLYFNDSNIITETMNDYLVLENRKDLEKFKSMSSIFSDELGSVVEASSKLMKQFEKLDGDNNKIKSANSNDGLIIPENLAKDPSKIDDDITGAVIERLPRESMVPMYIGKVCMGYYYLEFKENNGSCGFCGSHHMTPGVSNAANYANEMSEDQKELAVRYIASRMSQSIDAHFINSNKDLKEEIYTVLRYNEKFDIARSNDIGITFIPAEDIIHCYFEFDERAHRGISDLQKALIPSMLYILLYLTDIIGKVTRSTDKRIYYVKQNVETNIARTMMNVVQQIKKGNFGMRQIESMNNILNIVGKFNDFIIPMGQSGDPPIQFEVMNGQEINTPTEIMEKMEEAAVNTIIPFEMLNSTYQQDFAVRFTMSNTRFLKSIYTRQRKTEKWISKIYTKVYNYEFAENNSYIDVMLPPPVYLTMTNNQQIMDNITQQADKIIELELAEEEDEIKTEFKKLYTRSALSAYFDFDQIERFKMSAKLNVEIRKIPQAEEGSDDMDDEY